MFKTLLIIFLVYVLLKLIFGLVIPTVKVVGQVKRQMNNMKDQMESFQSQQQGWTQESKPKNKKKSDIAGEYIDFEEVTSK